MAEFLVTIRAIYEVSVEAEDALEAEDIAMETYASNGYEVDAYVDETEEVED